MGDLRGRCIQRDGYLRSEEVGRRERECKRKVYEREGFIQRDGGWESLELWLLPEKGCAFSRFGWEGVQIGQEDNMDRGYSKEEASELRTLGGG